MAKEHDFATREYARELYVVDGLTQEAVAAATGVSIQSIKEWSTADGWKEKRAEYRNALSGIKANTLKLQEALITKAMTSLDPQDIYAAVRLKNVVDKQTRPAAEVAAQAIDKPKLFLENFDFIARTLKEIDPEGLKVLAENYDEIVARFKAENEKAAAAN